MAAPLQTDVWLAAGVRTPFVKVDGALAGLDAIALSVPVVRRMVEQLSGGGKPGRRAAAHRCRRSASAGGLHHGSTRRLVLRCFNLQQRAARGCHVAHVIL